MILNTAIVVLKNNIAGSVNLLMEYDQSKIEVREFTGKNLEYGMKYDELTSTLSITGNDGLFQLIGKKRNSTNVEADGCCTIVTVCYANSPSC